MSKATITIRLGRAIGFNYDGKRMDLDTGYHVLPRAVWDAFRKEHPDYVKALLDDEKLQIDVKPGSTSDERRAKLAEEQREKEHFGPMTLVDIIQPGGFGSKEYKLRQHDGTVLSVTYGSRPEALKEMLERNTKAWEGWEGAQPKAKAS